MFNVFAVAGVGMVPCGVDERREVFVGVVPV